MHLERFKNQKFSHPGVTNEVYCENSNLAISWSLLESGQSDSFIEVLHWYIYKLYYYWTLVLYSWIFVQRGQGLFSRNRQISWHRRTIPRVVLDALSTDDQW